MWLLHAIQVRHHRISLNTTTALFDDPCLFSCSICFKDTLPKVTQWDLILELLIPLSYQLCGVQERSKTLNVPQHPHGTRVYKMGTMETDKDFLEKIQCSIYKYYNLNLLKIKSFKKKNHKKIKRQNHKIWQNTHKK